MTCDPNNKPSMTEQEESKAKAIDLAFNNQIKDMTSSALIYAASAIGMLLLWLGGPAVLAVMTPALTFSGMSLTRAWRLAKMTRRRRNRHESPKPALQTAKLGEPIDAGGEDNHDHAHELLIATFHELRRRHPLTQGSVTTGPGAPATRTVTCAWCGNRYRSAIPGNLDRGLQGSHCASDVIFKDGQWIVRGGYGSDEHDMNRYVFVANPPSTPADPVCDECVSQHLLDGDLQEEPPANHRRPEDFSPRPPGTHGLVGQIRRLLEEVAAMRGLVSVATRTVTWGHLELSDAVQEYQKHQRWTGELDDDGEDYAESAPEVARQMREAAQGLERLASSWERRSQEKPPMSAAPRVDDLLADTDAFTPASYQRERATLEQRFLTKHGTCAEDIDAAICRGALPCDDPLVEEWTALQALAPYMTTKDD